MKLKLSAGYLIAIGAFGLWSCSETKSTAPKKSIAPATDDLVPTPQTETPTSTPTTEDPCLNTTNLKLATPVTWNQDIKPLSDKYCVSCHSVGSQSGDYSTYALAKASGSAYVASVEKGSMPTTQKLTDAEKALFTSWKLGNYLEDSATSTTTVPTDTGTTPTTTSTSTCGTPPVGGNIGVLDEAAIKQCNAEGFVYYKGEKSLGCLKQLPLAKSFSCTKESIYNVFKSTGDLIKQKFTEIESQGYVLDQCGETATDKVIYFSKLSSDNTKVEMKVICNANSKYCVP